MSHGRIKCGAIDIPSGRQDQILYRSNRKRIRECCGKMPCDVRADWTRLMAHCFRERDRNPTVIYCPFRNSERRTNRLSNQGMRKSVAGSFVVAYADPRIDSYLERIKNYR